MRAVASLGVLEGAVATVIHAHAPFAKTLLAANANNDAVDDHVRAELEAARTKLKRFLQVNGWVDLLGRVCINEGKPIAVLRAFVEQQEPDLLVMGTHGRRRMERLLLGSVADEALRSLDVDILTVPPRVAS